MTTITFAKRDGLIRISAEGHATGSPEACAGISAILYALEGYLRLYRGKELRRARLEPGFALIEASARSSIVVEAFRTAAVGMGRIAASHPEQVLLLLPKKF